MEHLVKQQQQQVLVAIPNSTNCLYSSMDIDIPGHMHLDPRQPGGLELTVSTCHAMRMGVPLKREGRVHIKLTKYCATTGPYLYEAERGWGQGIYLARELTVLSHVQLSCRVATS